MTLIFLAAKILLGFLQLVIGLGLSMVSIYVGIRFFTRLTGGQLELEGELAKGNKAVAIFTLGLILSFAIVISGGVVGLTTAITQLPREGGVWEYFRAILGGFLQLMLGIILAGLGIFIGFRVWDKITKQIDELQELKNGNLAVGIVLAGVMVAVAIVINSGLGGLSAAIAP